MSQENVWLDDITPAVMPESSEEWLVRLVDAYEALRNQTEEILAARRALEDERARYQDLFDFAPDGYLVTDSRARILEANWAAASLLGTDRQKLIGSWLETYVSPADRHAFDAQLKIAAGSENATAWEMRFETRFSAPVHGSVKVTRLAADKPTEARLRWLIRDVTEQAQAQHVLAQQNEELQSLMSELDAFAHTVAHDLKQPLALIMGFTSLLAEDMSSMLDEQQERMIAGITQGTRQMARIVESLLLLASTRKDEVAIDALDMEAVVSRVTANLADEIEHLGAEVLVPDRWPIAVGYAPWVESAWANYLTNALKYGGRPPRVELGSEPDSEGMVRFWVRDNGQGLSMAQQEQLFAKFTRLDPLQSGHGLGLTIVRRIIKRLGGQVGVHSSPGAGSTFWFTLPSAS